MKPPETQGSGQRSSSTESRVDIVSCPEEVHSNKVSITEGEEEQGGRIGKDIHEFTAVGLGEIIAQKPLEYWVMFLAVPSDMTGIHLVVPILVATCMGSLREFKVLPFADAGHALS